MKDTVEELLDRMAISQLTAKYNYSADEGTPDDYVNTFVEDGVFDVVNLFTLSGADELRTVFESGTGRTLHVTTDPIIEIDGDTAKQVTSLLLFRRRADHSLNDLVSTGRYVDDLTRTADGWRFVRRTLTLHARSREVAAKRAE